MKDGLGEKIDASEMTISTFHSFHYDIMRQNSLESGVNPSSLPITRPSQLVWGLTNIDDFKFEHLNVGNNAERSSRLAEEVISSTKDLNRLVSGLRVMIQATNPLFGHRTLLWFRLK